MSLLPKTRFRWHEPKALVKAAYAAEDAVMKWWAKPALILLIVVPGMMATWYVGHLNPLNDPPPWYYALLGGIALGAFLAYPVPWLYRLFPSEVWVTDMCIMRRRGQAHWCGKFSEVESFRWGMQDGVVTLVLMHVRGVKRQEVVLGVPSTASQEEVTRLLLDRGVRQDRRQEQSVSV